MFQKQNQEYFGFFYRLTIRAEMRSSKFFLNYFRQCCIFRVGFKYKIYVVKLKTILYHLIQKKLDFFSILLLKIIFSPFFGRRTRYQSHRKLTLIKWRYQDSNPDHDVWPNNFGIFARRARTYGTIFPPFIEKKNRERLCVEN